MRDSGTPQGEVKMGVRRCKWNDGEEKRGVLPTCFHYSLSLAPCSLAPCCQGSMKEALAEERVDKQKACIL